MRFENTTAGFFSVRLDGTTVVYDLGGTTPTFANLISVTASTPGVRDVVEVSTELDGVAGGGDALAVPSRVIGAAPLELSAVGDTLGQALDVGVFGRENAITSLVFTESIDPQPFRIEPLGGNDDPGHAHHDEAANNLIQHINDNFGPDVTDGVTEVPYNFQGIFDTDGLGNDFLNQITERQKTRIREALGLWAQEIGIQFRETENEGITFALGNVDDLQALPGTQRVPQSALDATVRIDPTFANAAIVFSNRANFGTAYGEDFLRKATAGIGLLIGLEQTPNLPPQTLLSLSPGFLNTSIDVLGDLEPVFPGNFDVLHGNYVHRSDSIDVDLYRFEVNLNDADKQGTLTAETFAERLPDSSLLDTTLTLFEEVKAFATTDLDVGAELLVRIDALAEGRLGNNARIDFIRSERGDGDTAVRINQQLDSTGTVIPNAITVDMPQRGRFISEVRVGDVVLTAINDAEIDVRATTSGDAIRLIDETGETTSNLIVEQLGDNETAADLGLWGIDSASSTVTGQVLLSAVSTTTKLSDCGTGKVFGSRPAMTW